MCVIIDTNSIASVFNSNSLDHNEFQPIKKMIDNRHGKVVYGGTKYFSEIKRSESYMKVFIELGKSGKSIILNKEEVDTKEDYIKGINDDIAFNDTHIAAIVIISGCRIVCTKDASSDEFLKDKKFYPKNFKVPKIYRCAENAHLISNSSLKQNCAMCKNQQRS